MPHLLAIEDPNDPTVDLGAKMYRIDRVLLAFHELYSALLVPIRLPGYSVSPSPLGSVVWISTVVHDARQHIKNMMRPQDTKRTHEVNRNNLHKRGQRRRNHHGQARHNSEHPGSKNSSRLTPNDFPVLSHPLQQPSGSARASHYPKSVPNKENSHVLVEVGQS